jgi:hypothetical protein
VIRSLPARMSRQKPSASMEPGKRALTPTTAMGGAEDRAAPLVVGREAVVRVHVGRPDGWDGALSVTARIGADTFTAPVDGEWTATLPIPASAMAAGVDYEVAVTEGATTHDQVTADLEAIETGVLRLRLVPFEVDGFVPDTSPAVVEGYRAALMAVYPVTDVLIDVAPVEVWTEAFDLGAVNVRVGVLQEDAMVAGDVDPDVYYYGMVTGVATREEFSGSTGTSENGGTQEPVNRAYFAVGAAFGDQRSEDTLIPRDRPHPRARAHRLQRHRGRPGPELPVRGRDHRRGGVRLPDRHVRPPPTART